MAQQIGPAETQTPAPQQNLPAGNGNGFWERGNLLGDLSWMSIQGVSAGLSLANEAVRSTSGGYETTTHIQTLATLSLGLDTAASFGWPGGHFYTSAFAISGSGVSIDGVHSLTTISSIEAEPALRLFDLWYEQRFFGDRLSVRVGQMGADEDFLLTKGGEVFLNGDFGWPTLASIDLPSGGANYPLATPGARLKLAVTPKLTFLAGIFNGNPSPDTISDPQQTDRFGLNFRTDGGVMSILEMQWRHEFSVGHIVLPGTYKLGGWWNTNTFPDQHLDANGLSLADFNSTGLPALRRNDWSVYATAEQSLWSPGGQGEQGVSLFLRWMAAPDDRNPVSVEIDGGLAWRGPFANRPNDTFGIGGGWFKISQAARALDRELSNLSVQALGLSRPVRSAEGLVEATYQAEIAPWWQIQPDLQYIIRPAGGVPGAEGSNSFSAPLRNSLIIAVRSTITF